MKGVEPVTYLVAVEGEHWLGTSLMGKGAPDEGYTYLTGVRRHARGRGLAHALKIASLLRARDLGLARVGTNNDSRNTPMLAINKALGYRHGAGVMLYRKPL